MRSDSKKKPEGSEVGNFLLSHREEIKSEVEEKDIIPVRPETAFFPTSDPSADRADFDAFIEYLAGWRSEPDRSDLARFLRANPGMTVRDWKGKGPSIPLDAEPWEKPWHRLKAAKVRAEAVRWFARELPRNIRQAAARDPGLIWNPLARKYRLRLPSDPPADPLRGQKVKRTC